MRNPKTCAAPVSPLAAPPIGDAGLWMSRLHRDESGATATEYILILALVVLPIAALFPLFMKMVQTYGGRMTHLMGLPFP